MPSFLLDTNHLGVAATPAVPLRETVMRRARAGDRFGTCVPVLCELEVGIQQTRDPSGYRQELSTLMKHVRVWPLTEQTARIYGQLRLSLIRRGRVLSQVDVIVAAVALERHLKVLTTDGDFEGLPEVTTENWLR